MRVAGDRFEQRARSALEKAGLTLLAANYTTRHGEIDLVMREADTIVFVEVRYRVRAARGDALASITPTKQSRLIRAASLWLSAHPRDGQRPCRFDVVCYDGPEDAARMQWHKAAFDAS